MRFDLFGLTALWAMGSVAFSQPAPTAQHESAVIQRAPSMAGPEREAADIIDLFYDLRFGPALEAAQRLEIRYKDSPAGAFYRGVAYYQQYLLEDPPQKATFEHFEEAAQTSLAKAKRLVRYSTALGHYYQGAVLGFQARAFIAQGRYAAAIPKARQGVWHLRKALALDSSLIDAKLGLGLYYYFLDRVPAGAKPFAYLMVGMWGDRSKGLQLLSEVADHGLAARREAQSVLATLYASEKEQKWSAALALLTPLLEQYPHNPRYRLLKIYVFEREGRWGEAASLADSEGAWILGLDPIWRARAQSVARYRAVECELFQGRWPDAVILLDRLESEEVPRAMADWVALRRGNALDAQGRSEEAAAFYNMIKNQTASSLAQVFLKTPFPAGPRDVMSGRWPLPSVPE